MRALFLFTTVLVSTIVTGGQETNPPPCPELSVDGPSNVIKPGEIATYVINIDLKGLDITPLYKWTISTGTIISGQGTNKIEIRNPTGWNTTVSVEVEGLPLGCPNLESETTIPETGPTATKIAEVYGPLTTANFDGLVDAAKGDPSSQLYISLSGPPRRPTQSIAAKRKLILTKLGAGIGDKTRLTFIESTTRDDLAVFWLVPPGATPPLP